MTSTRSLRALDALNFLVADITGGVGPFLVVYLSTQMHWAADRIGMLMFACGLAGVLAQAPAGGYVDRYPKLPRLVALAAIAVGAGSLGSIASPAFGFILGAQSLVAIAGVVFAPAIAAISIGIVGRRNAEGRFGRNQSVSSAGNVVIAIVAGLLGHYSKPSSIFLLVGGMSLLVALSSLAIRNGDIDYRVARGADGQPDSATSAAAIGTVFKNPDLRTFALCAVLFHFANACMLMLIVQAGGAVGGDTLATTAYIVISQAVMVPMGFVAGRYAQCLPRKPVFLIAFWVLPVRGVLFSLGHSPYGFAAIQILDGIGAGIFGVMQVLVIADLAKGTGRFNLAQGVVGTAVAIGAACSQVAGGFVAKQFGYPAAFLTMAAIAAFALMVFWLRMPETRPARA